MQTLLQIGEIAKLVGVTPKAVRHYTRLGLLSEPERTEGGYRLYTVRDLLRLQRIRQLQSLGLSLAHIKQVLGKPEQEQTLREVLQSILGELDKQISTLEGRREWVKKLLTQDSLAELTPTPPALETARKNLASLEVEISPAAWEQEKKLWQLLDNFQWPVDMNLLQQEMTDYFVVNQEAFRAMVAILERFAVLADLPEDAPEIDKLVVDWAEQLKNLPTPVQLTQLSWAEGKLGQVLSDMWATDFSPAQKRAMEKMKALQETESNQPKNL